MQIDGQVTATDSVDEREPSARLFRLGFLTMVPLWAGVVPFGAAFGVLARTAGYDILQTQAFSAFIFAGAAQVAAVTITAGGGGAVAIILTTLLLNLRHVLYGLSLRPFLPQHVRPPRALLAYLLTDEAYGVTIRAYLDGRSGPFFLFGAGLSLYIAFNAATLAGAVLGSIIPDPHHIGLDFIFPLTFLALLVPLLRSRTGVVVALVSGICALVLSRLVPGGITILVSTLLAASLGVLLDRREERA